jgi:protein TonB
MLREADSVGVAEDANLAFASFVAASAPGMSAVRTPAPRYGEGKGFNWPGLVLTVFLHVLLVAGFLMIRDHVVKKREEKLTVVNLTPAPPPPAATPEPPKQQRVEVVTPRPMVQIPMPSPVSIPTTPDPVPMALPPSPLTANTAPPAPPAPPSIVQASDLGNKMVAGKAPSYPVDSRRKREEGTVVLTLTLGLDGRVASIAVSKTSGFARLDEAALSAVRKWRWEPIMRNGQPVMVRGLVEIPFVIKVA